MIQALPRYLLLFILLFLGIGGLYGGLMLTIDPSGQLLQMPPGSLDGSPFGNFLIPGLTLLAFNGMMPLLVVFGLLRRPHWEWAEWLNLYPDRHWAWTFSLYNGIILSIWINVQLFFVTERSALQPSFGLVALAIIVLTMAPPVVKYYEKKS